MPGAEAVVLALTALGKAGDSAALPQGREAVAPSGQQLMNIALMPHIKNQMILRRGEHPVNSERQLHRTEVGRQVPARFADLRNQVFPDLLRQRRHIRRGHFFQIVRAVDLPQQGIMIRPESFVLDNPQPLSHHVGISLYHNTHALSTTG